MKTATMSLYTEGAMKGKPKYRIKLSANEEVLNTLYMATPSQPAGTHPKQEYSRTRRDRFEREQEFLETVGIPTEKDSEERLYQILPQTLGERVVFKASENYLKTSYNRFMRFA